MAVAFLSTPASMTAEQYDRVIEQLEASGAGDSAGTPIPRTASVQIIT